MAILPLILGFVEIGFLRIFRVFRILRLIRFMKRKYLFGRLTNEEEYIGANLLFTIFAIIFVSSGLMYQIESPINPDINTFFDSTYYMVISLTTVGFGDITPVSTQGRAITLLAIAAGIIFVPIQISTFFKKIIDGNCTMLSHLSDLRATRNTLAVVSDRRFDVSWPDGKERIFLKN